MIALLICMTDNFDTFVDRSLVSLRAVSFFFIVAAAFSSLHAEIQMLVALAVSSMTCHSDHYLQAVTPIFESLGAH